MGKGCPWQRPGRNKIDALLTAVLAHQAAAVVGVRTCWPWETAAMLPSTRQWKARTGDERGGGMPWWPPTYSLLSIIR